MKANGAEAVTVAAAVAAAAAALDDERAGDAIRFLAELPELGFAFATKICAFLAPSVCGVADSIIAERLPEFAFSTRGGYLTNTADNRQRYDVFCRYLRTTAAKLNSHGSAWEDMDGTRSQWRALDVERALFA